MPVHLPSFEFDTDADPSSLLDWLIEFGQDLAFKINSSDATTTFDEQTACVEEVPAPLSTQCLNRNSEGCEHENLEYQDSDAQGVRVLVHIGCKDCGTSAGMFVVAGDLQWPEEEEDPDKGIAEEGA